MIVPYVKAKVSQLNLTHDDFIDILSIIADNPLTVWTKLALDNLINGYMGKQ